MSEHLGLALVLAAAVATASCQTIGTGSVQRDRIGYADAIGTSWKEQMLLNIVKLRYLDSRRRRTLRISGAAIVGSGITARWRARTKF